MKAKIIKIGNSKEIIISHNLLELIDLEEKVSIKIEGNKMIITPIKSKPREGREEILAEDVAEYGQPERLIPDFLEDENVENW